MQQLMLDPRSRFHAAVAGWQHPVTWGDLVLMDLYDLHLARYVGEKGTPYERPWVKPKPVKPKKRRTADEALRILRPHRPTP